MKKINKIVLLGFLLSLFVISCKKQNDFLAAVPRSDLSVISNLDQLQNLLQYDRIINGDEPMLAIISADEYYSSYSNYLAAQPLEKNAYIWAKNIYPNLPVPDWNGPYNKIYYSNVVLDNLKTINYTKDQQSQYNLLKGTALFNRAFEFYALMQLFAKPYDQPTASNDLGIPLRLTSDINVKAPRSSVSNCYSQIIQDIQASLSYLPETVNYQTFPTSAAANALLARVYLTMGDYQNALKYANISLTLNNVLIDYNTLPNQNFGLTAASRFPLAEGLYMTSTYNATLTIPIRVIVDSTLYASYDNNDLRKSLFFQNYNNAIRFKGSYEFKNFGPYFTGLANDEVYLVRAECNARLGNTSDAMNDLNTLLVKRYATGSYVNRTASSADDALIQILNERKKELIFRGTRWTDLRRLNLDSRFQVTLTRNLNGVVYTLPPNDPRYVFALPDEEVQLTGVPQNQR